MSELDTTRFEAPQFNPVSHEAPITTVSAAELCEAFGIIEEEAKNAGLGKRFGNSVTIDFGEGFLVIKDRKKWHGRVTQVQLTDDYIGRSGSVTHEIHFPSEDSEYGDYSVAYAALVKHNYDEEGMREDSDVKTFEVIDLEAGEVQEFLAGFEEAHKRIQSKIPPREPEI